MGRRMRLLLLKEFLDSCFIFKASSAQHDRVRQSLSERLPQACELSLQKPIVEFAEVHGVDALVFQPVPVSFSILTRHACRFDDVGEPLQPIDTTPN
jgi:hypothetical protein